MAQQLQLKDFLDYRFLSQPKYAPDGKHAAFVVANANEEENCYEHRLWLWDGAALKGAKIGMIFQDRQWEYNGKTGFTAQPYTLISLEALRSGEFKIPEPKYLSSAAQSASTSPAAYQDAFSADDDLPF